MALYRLETKIISRQVKDRNGKPIQGRRRSIVAKAAYRAGQRLKEEREERIFNYAPREGEVIHSEILASDKAPSWLQDPEGETHGGGRNKQRDLRERLWNEIDRVEKRKDAQLAREFVISLPVELDEKQQVEAVRSWLKSEFVDKGAVVDLTVHRSKDGKNPHAHALMPLRPVEGEGFGKKPDMAGKFNAHGNVGYGAKSDLDTWRESWEKQCNAALEAAGEQARVDRRSLQKRGIDRLPQPKIGPAAQAMERKGVETDRHELVIWTKMDNLSRPALRGIEQTGEVPQAGTGQTWWERAQVAIGRAWAHAGDFFRDESSGGRRLSQSDDSLRPNLSTDPSSWTDYISQKLATERERGSPDPGFG